MRRCRTAEAPAWRGANRSAHGYFDELFDASVAAVVAASLDVFRQCPCGHRAVEDSAIRRAFLDNSSTSDEGGGRSEPSPVEQTRTGDYSEEVGKRLEAGFFILVTGYITRCSTARSRCRTFWRKCSRSWTCCTRGASDPMPTLKQTAYSSGPAYLKMVISLTRNTRPLSFLGLPAQRHLRPQAWTACRHRFSWWGGPSREQLLLQLGHRDQQETRASTRRAEGPWPPP